MNLKIDIRSVEHAHFIMHIAEYQKRAGDLNYSPDIRKSWGEIAVLLEDAAVMKVVELEAFQVDLRTNKALPQGSFARSRTAMIIDDYLDQIERLIPNMCRPFVASTHPLNQ